MPDPIADVWARADAEVTTAEQEAAEAQQLAGTLEERVREGDDSVTAEEIAGARELGRFARLRADATRRKAEKAKASARLAACEELRTEIETHATGAGAELADLLKTAEDAVTAFVAAVDARNVQVKGWHDRLRALAVPEHHAPIAPPAEHGRLGWRGERVVAGRRVVEPLSADLLLSAMLRRVSTPSTGHYVQVRPHDRVTDVYGQLAGVDAEAPEPSPDLVFFRGPGGAISQFGHDRVPDAEEIARLGLVEVSRKEAWGE